MKLRGVRYITEVSSRTILTVGEDRRSLSHTNIISKFFLREVMRAKQPEFYIHFDLSEFY